MFSQFIRKPVLSLVVAIFIILLGILGLMKLPVTQFPNIAPPEVNVAVEYTGANAETIVKATIVPLERAINGVPGMKYMYSYSGNDGIGWVRIIFELGTDPDIASVNVQNRVNSITDELPQEVIKNGVKIAKEENAMLMYIDIFSEDTTMKEKFLYNFADINVLAELKRVKGVGFADILGAKDYAMRIWLKPDKMLTYNISTQDVNEALDVQNIESAPGVIGENSDKLTNFPLQYAVKYSGKYNTKEAYENIPIKASSDGKILRIKDIAEVEFGTTYYDVESKFNGRPSASIMLKQLPGSNASEVIKNIKIKIQELKEKTFIKGMDFSISYDVSRFLDASIIKVIKTILEAFILVSLVVFIFLQNLRATLISCITIPVSLIGTFFFISMLGFSLNLITLFALVLAIGIVVDDSIVVVEAVHAKIEELHLSVLEATQVAMKEITGAILGITLVMSAVFIPVAFLGGPTGIFYKQFSLTMAIAIVLSGVVSLTLTPALCAMLMVPHNPKGHHNFIQTFFDKFNKWYDKLSSKYKKLLKILLHRRFVIWGSLLCFLMLVGLLSKVTPSGFIPNEDQSIFYVSVVTPSGATLERTKAVVNSIQKIASTIPDIESVSSLAGSNILSDGTGAIYGTLLVNLKSWDDRKTSVTEVMEELEKRVENIKGAKLEFLPPPAVPGYGNASGFELRLLDKTGTSNFATIERVLNTFILDLKQRPEISSAFSMFNASNAQYLLRLDIDKAAQKGVTAKNAMGSLQTLLGSEYATNFIRFGQMYKVMLQALPEYRGSPEDILNLYVKNDQGDMVAISAFVTLEKVYGVNHIIRYNMYPAADITGASAAGYSSADAIKAIQEVAQQKLPKGFDIDWAGITKDEVSTGNEAIYIFIICLLFVYLILSAQYESFLLPLPVLLSLPTGIFGVFLFLYLFGLENNIYAQIAMIMLIGLLSKNAILIIEFANIKYKQGESLFNASIEAATLRLRPILMTSFAFIVGLIPLMFATGVGALGNRTIGSAAAGGMLLGTLFGVLIIPGLYYIIESFSKKNIKRKI